MGYDDALRIETLLSLTVLLQPGADPIDQTYRKTCALCFNFGIRAFFLFLFVGIFDSS